MIQNTCLFANTRDQGIPGFGEFTDVAIWWLNSITFPYVFGRFSSMFIGFLLKHRFDLKLSSQLTFLLTFHSISLLFRSEVEVRSGEMSGEMSGELIFSYIGPTRRSVDSVLINAPLVLLPCPLPPLFPLASSSQHPSFPRLLLLSSSFRPPLFLLSSSSHAPLFVLPCSRLHCGHVCLKQSAPIVTKQCTATIKK